MKTVLAVDGNSILNRAFYGIKVLTSSGGVPTNALTGFVNILLKNMEKVSPDILVVAFDRKAPTFRHAIYSGYKANRKGMPDELAAQLPFCKKIAEAMGFTVLEEDGIEADDMLGTVSELSKRSGAQCYILTGDRDSLQLISDTTKVLLAGNKDTEIYDREKFKERYLTEPQNLIELKALMGDSSDCIPGVSGIGEKTAVKLISEYSNLENIYASIDELPVGPAAKEKIRNDKDMAFLSRLLATIKTDVDIKIDEVMKVPTPNIQLLMQVLSELEMFGTLSKIQNYPLYNDKTDSSALMCDEIEVKHLDSIASFDSLKDVSFDGDFTRIFYFEDDTINEYSFKDVNEATSFIVENISFFSMFDSKKLYRFLLANGIRSKLTVKEDVMLAAYVANSGLQKYSFDKLVTYFLHMVCDEFDPASEAYYMPKLREKLVSLLIESEQEHLYRDIEMPLALVIAEMENVGVLVDVDGLKEYGDILEEEAQAIEQQIYMHAGKSFNINSPKQLGAVLFEELNLPARKKNKNGYSTDAETLEALSAYHPIIDLVLEYRTLTKLKSTFVDAMITAVDKNDGRIHSRFNQATTATGRLSSADPNLQNIPVRQKRGRELRRFFKAKEGNLLIDADYSQIELRLLAEISRDRDFINAFSEGEDIHTLTASQVFSVPQELVSSELRSRAKAVNFGIIYGISAFSLSRDIGTTRMEAQRYIDGYLARFTGVSEYLKNIVKKAKDQGYVTTIFGRRRYIPELMAGKKTEQSFGERVAMNSPIQGSAADIIKLAMVNVYNKLSLYPEAKLVLQVHDELIIEAPERFADELAKLLRNEMENVIATSVPLTVEVKTGKTWYDTKD